MLLRIGHAWHAAIRLIQAIILFVYLGDLHQFRRNRSYSLVAVSSVGSAMKHREAAELKHQTFNHVLHALKQHITAKRDDQRIGSSEFGLHLGRSTVDRRLDAVRQTDQAGQLAVDWPNAMNGQGAATPTG